MAELADALGSGSSVRKDMGVQVPLRPPSKLILIPREIKINLLETWWIHFPPK